MKRWRLALDLLAAAACAAILAPALRPGMLDYPASPELVIRLALAILLGGTWLTVRPRG